MAIILAYRKAREKLITKFLLYIHKLNKRVYKLNIFFQSMAKILFNGFVFIKLVPEDSVLLKSAHCIIQNTANNNKKK